MGWEFKVIIILLLINMHHTYTGMTAILLVSYKRYESFDNFKSDYPCRVFLTDKDFLKHMTPHHQVAVDMCKILLKHTKSDFLIYLAYRMIREQESEIILPNDMLRSPLL